MNLLQWIKARVAPTAKTEDVIEIFDFNSVYKSNKVMSELRRLTLGSWSGMNYELDNLSILAKQRKVKVKVITAKRQNKMVGWALLSKEDSNFPFERSNFVSKRDGALFEVFVDPKHRRTGIATALLKKARKHTGSSHLCVAPHDRKSNAFYDKHNMYKQKRLSY